MLVTVVPHDEAWAGLYEAEAARIRAVLGESLVAIHHIGSTAVPGLAAKPIIDLLPVVTDVALADACTPQFEALGYECMGEFGIPGRRFLRNGGDVRTHHVHIFGLRSRADIARHLAVRDYLRAHPAAAAEYGRLKAELAAWFPEDIGGYCDGKDAFVKALERAALAWYEGSHLL
jgi:GrpB-like predicted nucleotidyltransferase (UPF0157 family)